MIFAFVAGAVFGGVVIGALANRKPQWFAKVVSAANAVDAKVNVVAAQTADAVKK